MLAGIGMEYKGQGVACNALWPATMVESYATINFKVNKVEVGFVLLFECLV